MGSGKNQNFKNNFFIIKTKVVFKVAKVTAKRKILIDALSIFNLFGVNDLIEACLIKNDCRANMKVDFLDFLENLLFLSIFQFAIGSFKIYQVPPNITVSDYKSIIRAASLSVPFLPQPLDRLHRRNQNRTPNSANSAWKS